MPGFAPFSYPEINENTGSVQVYQCFIVKSLKHNTLTLSVSGSVSG